VALKTSDTRTAQPVGDWRAGRLALGLKRDSAAWGMSPRVAVAVALAPIVGMGLMVLTMRFVRLFDWLTRENSLLESTQFVLLVAATCLFVLVAVRLARGGDRPLAAVYAVGGLGAAFVAGEEISWGQSVFQWEGSEWLTSGNFQGETNLHTGVAHGPTVYGFILVGLYGSVAPWFGLRLGLRRNNLARLLVPPLVVVPAFAIPFGYRAVRAATSPEERLPRYALQIVEFAEFAELCLYFGLLAVALLTWRSYRQRGVSAAGSRDD
jgi:hypothetical protein